MAETKFYIKQGFWIKTKKEILGALDLKRAVKFILRRLHIAYVDDCCVDDTDTTQMPVQFNEDDGTLTYFDGTDNVPVPIEAGGVSGLPPNLALISDGTGELSTSTVTNVELGYVSGVTSAIQTQLTAKAPLASPTFTGTVVLPATTSIGTITNTELGFVDGVTSSIQTQLNGKATLVAAPATATSTGVTGQIAIASGFFYACVATNTWQRVAIATW